MCSLGNGTPLPVYRNTTIYSYMQPWMLQAAPVCDPSV